MFALPDLIALVDAAPAPGVSIFLPTHVLGRETRQDPIRLKNLLGEAEEKLTARGLSSAEAQAMLAPAAALVDDHEYWQHQSHGLALFLDHQGLRPFKVPLDLEERVHVSDGFLVKPLLPVLARDGLFHVLAVSEDSVHLFAATRFSMAEEAVDGMPRSLGEVMGESADYENPVNASPANRPDRSGGAGPGAAQARSQVYGDSPEEWQKTQQNSYLRRIAGALDAHLSEHGTAAVLVADPALAGNFPRTGAVDRLLVGTVTRTPAGMTEAEIHAAAYAVMLPHLDAARQAALERFAALQGSGDAKGSSIPADIVVAAHEGRVDTLLLAEGVDLPGRYDAAARRVMVGQGSGDLPDLAAAQTLRHGGAAFVLPREAMPRGVELAAILRY
jgi:hypothetical protein